MIKEPDLFDKGNSTSRGGLYPADTRTHSNFPEVLAWGGEATRSSKTKTVVKCREAGDVRDSRRERGGRFKMKCLPT